MEKMARNQDDEDVVMSVFGGELGKSARPSDIYLLIGDTLSRDRARNALERLSNRGWLQKAGSRGSVTYTLVAVADE